MINVSKEFARMPCVRSRKDGPQSGEEFRDDILIPALRNNERVIVDLNGVIALGSSFLDEAFGGLVREGVYTAQELHRKLTINFSLQSYVNEAWGYIDGARRRA
ncbi:DUF4325 domain-containing protein [Pseudomonas sp. BN414]|uniref:STAS-like domain-containing protein n=1 Tax=Pseudomonas sp. BN414 TaxID=2567888 RepID=UPI002454A486|nr:STAS-like domain-containing protein [Pseudomonas sp. BN414]MDH4567754.1 DUF4325 domain-containing protein [Pseudomonas sp. BN414]